MNAHRNPARSLPLALALAFTLLVPLTAAAKKKPYQEGRIISMQSSTCGYNRGGGNLLATAVLGTNTGGGKAKVLLCKNYTLVSNGVRYTIRPKQDNAPLLDLSTPVLFRIDKDKIRLHPEGEKHDRVYLVLAEQADEMPPVQASAARP